MITVLAAALALSWSPHQVVANAADVPAASSAGELAGLWKATRRFGPDARGPLTIERTASGWMADFIGRTIPVRADDSVLTFNLPNGDGSFRGRLQPDSSSIIGHWTPANSVFMGFRYAVPVRLQSRGPGRWRGSVVPRDDSVTLYLMLRELPDGSVEGFIRNPERNIGIQYDVNRIVRDGNDVALMGKVNGAPPEIALVRGILDPQTQILSIFFQERGGTYDFKRDTDPQSGFYPRGQESVRYVYRAPLARDDGWPTATLDEVNIDRKGIEAFIQMIIDTPVESAHTPGVDGILIARHGKLVLEEYFHGFSRDTLHETRSAAKSLTATIVGAAMQAGEPLELSTPVYKLMNGGIFPESLDPLKREMTLEDLLMMRSGYYCDDGDPAAPGNEDTMLDQTSEPDFYRYVLKVPMAFPPDQHSVYCSTNPNLALGMVGVAAKESPMDAFDRLVGGPMKINYYAWPLDGVGHPYGGGSVQLFPRDFMKLGQLMLNGGTWHGRRILSREFVARASAPLHDLNGIQYGYLWWSINYPYKNRTVRAFFAGGNGGQMVMAVPELDLVIATFAENYADRIGLHVQQDYTPNYILPAVRESGDDPNARVVQRNFKTPYGRRAVPTPMPSPPPPRGHRHI